MAQKSNNGYSRNAQRHKEIIDRIHTTYVAKNKDYGNSATKTYKEFGPLSYAIRFTDKLERYKSLIAKDAKVMVSNESLLDTLMDLANYSIMAIMDITDDSDTITVSGSTSPASVSEAIAILSTKEIN